jgi:RNA polymerase sigma factor (TIGR02999 family)
VSSRASVTDLLAAWNNGDEGALTTLLPLVYTELRQIAGRHLRREREGHTLQPTALVHEAYARLIAQGRVPWQSRAHFLAVAAKTMRRILVEPARKRHAAQRGGQGIRITLDEPLSAAVRQDVDVISLEDALTGLSKQDETQAKIVELRFFGGLGIRETAELMGISPATVKREWTVARAWLSHEMTKP